MACPLNANEGNQADPAKELSVSVNLRPDIYLCARLPTQAYLCEIIMDGILKNREVELPGGFTLHVCNQQPSITAVLRAVKREEHGLYNCIASIAHDFKFIELVTGRLPSFPLLANLRCGLWYVPDPTATCYFKSTDGHSGQWSFSLARLNLHVASFAAEYGGVCIVDATRRGKAFPDALTKTVPTWAAVMNRAMACLRQSQPADMSNEKPTSTQPWDLDVHLPAWIPSSEKNEISKRLDTWTESLLAMGVDLGHLAVTLRAPLRCFWFSQQSQDSEDEIQSLLDDKLREIMRSSDDGGHPLPFTPVVLVSASLPNARHRRCLSLRAKESIEEFMYDYVPGAGDDEESWACGLTPDVLWADTNLNRLLQAGPHDIASCVRELVSSRRGAADKMRCDAGAGIGADGAWDVRWCGHPGLALGLVAHVNEGIMDSDNPASYAIIDISGGCIAIDPGELTSLTQGVRAFGDNPALPVYVLRSADKIEKVLKFPDTLKTETKHVVVRILPAAVAFAAHHWQIGRRVLVVGEPRCMDVAAAVALGCLIGCYRLETPETENGTQLVWAGPVSAFVSTSPAVLEPAEGRHAFSRTRVRQYLSVLMMQYPQLVLSKSFLRQVFNAFLLPMPPEVLCGGQAREQSTCSQRTTKAHG